MIGPDGLDEGEKTALRMLEKDVMTALRALNMSNAAISPKMIRNMFTTSLKFQTGAANQWTPHALQRLLLLRRGLF